MAFPVDESQASVARLVCERFLVYATSVMEEYPGLSRNLDFRVNEAHDHINRCVMFLKGWMLDGHKVVRVEDHTINFPASPWDFFKQRHFPAWALRWWPVKEAEHRFAVHEHHHHICPHMVADPQDRHIMFMYEGVNGKIQSDKA